MLALHGFDAYGLEVSEKGSKTADGYAASELKNPNRINFGEDGSWLEGQRGSCEIVAGDFFKRDWESACATSGATGFDLIYDYTVRYKSYP